MIQELTATLEIGRDETFTTTLEAPVIVTKIAGRFQSKTVTPTAAGVTVLPDSGYNAMTSVEVSPIPSNYGLITWDGSVLTVS